jgi:hypothetical protein
MMPQAYNRQQPMNDVKRTAAERARKLGLSYAGALLPGEAHELMKAGAKLVDVRSSHIFACWRRAQSSEARKFRSAPSRSPPICGCRVAKNEAQLQYAGS